MISADGLPRRAPHDKGASFTGAIPQLTPTRKLEAGAARLDADADVPQLTPTRKLEVGPMASMPPDHNPQLTPTRKLEV